MAAIIPTLTITTHNPDGSVAIHPSSGPIDFPADTTTLQTLYTTHTLPIVLDDEADVKQHTEWTANPVGKPNPGTRVVYVRFPPGAEMGMHVTPTVDFGVVVDGEVELLLPGGETRLLRRGDVVIQRGMCTVHM
ncbi:hypothetical protein TWF696_000864 [Orbilia brochopaga]|uniref:Cupin type-2 domain-containing protein n=1 Tax=Orbilia brochopaga TaxID=3140254 RepID=A0AAV9VG43_9PEZI